MMKFQAPRPKNDDERILPLINVVFLLLIFFMLAGRLAASDPFQVNPAESESMTTAQTPDLLVLVGADGQLALEGEVMEADSLKEIVAGYVQPESEPPVVRLKADGQAEAVKIVEVMELLRDAGITKLKLLTVPEKG
ncbi:ExbD/TolR family protein [Rhodovibrionaceae bacterium A322]